MKFKKILIGGVLATSSLEGMAMPEKEQEKHEPSEAVELGLSEEEYQDFMKALDSIHETKLSDGDLVAWSIGNYKCGTSTEKNV